MGFSSGRSSKGKRSSPHLSSLLEQHLPKRARSLVSLLSDDDLEVLTYILAYGLHLQMLVGVVFPAEKLQWKSVKPFSGAKVGQHRERISPQTSRPLSSQCRSKQGKASSFLAHKISRSCDCFSCYSSFWSRWAASPNRDVLSEIIEITEEEEDRKVDNGKESTKKQDKKKSLSKVACSKKLEGNKSKSQGTFDSPVCLRAMSEPVDSMPSSQDFDNVCVATSIDVLCKAPWNITNVEQALSFDRPSKGDFVTPVPVTSEGFLTGPGMKDAFGCTASVLEKQSRVAVVVGVEAPSLALRVQGKTSSVLEAEVHGCLSAQAPLGEPLQGKGNANLHRLGKRKSNQIMPLDFEGGQLILSEHDGKFGQFNKSEDGSECPWLMDVSIRERGVLSRVFPHSLCDIATRIWDLVSLGSLGMEYY